MQSRSVPDWVDGFMQLTDVSEAPDLFRYWTAISCVAAALQRKCYVQMGALTFYPNMYVVLCAPPGVRKGTAMGPGYDLLNEIGIKLSAQATTLQALIKRLKNTNYTQVDPTTGEMQFHASLTVFSKEFTVFLGYRNQELMSHLCDWYDCENKWKYETISRGEDEIIGVWVNILGATTPDLIQSSLPIEMIGGGLTTRMIIVLEIEEGKFVPFPQTTPQEARLRNMLRDDLEKIHLMSGRFKFEKEFIDAWIDWRVRTRNSPPKFSDQRFSGYMQRRPAHLMKISMIMCASRSSDMILRECDIRKAIKALDDVEVHMPKVFSGVGRSDISDLIPRVVTWISVKKQTTMKELMKEFYYDADVWTMERVIKSLEIQESIVKVTTERGTLIKANTDVNL